MGKDFCRREPERLWVEDSTVEGPSLADDVYNDVFDDVLYMFCLKGLYLAVFSTL